MAAHYEPNECPAPIMIIWWVVSGALKIESIDHKNDSADSHKQPTREYDGKRDSRSVNMAGHGWRDYNASLTYWNFYSPW